jgi:L-threonylcarbamoyladenylate synthase
MPVLKLDPDRPDTAILERAADVLRRGGLVAFPTETVYGLGANALDEAAVRRIFEAKGRPSFNPLIVHVHDAAGAKRLAAAWPEEAERLAAAFWPGPLTLVLPKRSEVPEVITAGLPTFAVRVPAHPVARALLEAAGLPIAAPSANRYTEISPTTAQHVEKSLGDRVDLILDGGPTDVGIESTIVDLAGDEPRLLRPGTIPVAEIEALIGPLATAGRMTGAAPRPAPGMVERHYAPRAALRLFGPTQRGAAAAEAARAAAGGDRVGALSFADFPAHRAVRMPFDAAAYAARLYAALHEMDDVGCALVFVEEVPDTPEWAGVRDRLRRAADPQGRAG